jgi:hypothetical protein
MKHIANFLNSWNDTASKERLRRSDKSKEVQKADIENYLKSMSLRYERSPQAGVLQNWAQDIVDSGYEDWMVQEVCKVIPFKLERHPNLCQLIDLLRPYLVYKKEAQVDELDLYTQSLIPHLKERFMSLVGDEVYTKMLLYYKKEVMPDSELPVETPMLMDWCRSYFSSDPKKIIEQGKTSNKYYEQNDKSYFLRTIKNYAIEKGLDKVPQVNAPTA